jgi:hypothetical protein
MMIEYKLKLLLLPLPLPLPLPTADLSSPRYDICARVYRFHWFSFAFVAVTLIGMMITAITKAGLHYSRPFWIGECAAPMQLSVPDLVCLPE